MKNKIQQSHCDKVNIQTNNNNNHCTTTSRKNNDSDLFYELERKTVITKSFPHLMYILSFYISFPLLFIHFMRNIIISAWYFAIDAVSIRCLTVHSMVQAIASHRYTCLCASFFPSSRIQRTYSSEMVPLFRLLCVFFLARSPCFLTRSAHTHMQAA